MNKSIMVEGKHILLGSHVPQDGGVELLFFFHIWCTENTRFCSGNLSRSSSIYPQSLDNFVVLLESRWKC